MPAPEKYKVDGSKIRAERERRGWTMEEAAERAGMFGVDGKPSRQSWYQVESGRRGRKLQAGTLYQVAEALGRKMEHFIAPTDAPAAPAVPAEPAAPPADAAAR